MVRNTGGRTFPAGHPPQAYQSTLGAGAASTRHGNPKRKRGQLGSQSRLTRVSAGHELSEPAASPADRSDVALDGQWEDGWRTVSMDPEP